MTPRTELDYAPLTAHPSTEDLDALRRAVQAGDFGELSRQRYGKQRDGILVFALIGGFLGLIFGVMALVAFVRGNSEDAFIGLCFVGGVLAIGAVAGGFASFDASRDWRHVWRLAAFARTNGWSFEPAAKVTVRPGSIFTTKNHASTTHRLSWTVAGVPVELANHHRNRNGHSFAARYLAVPAEGLPRLTFVGKAPGAVRPGLQLGTEVVLPEGKAPKRRRGKLTSAAKGSDLARAFLTDEVVGLLTDARYPSNAQIVGGWFYAYFDPRQKVDENSMRHMVALAAAIVRAAADVRRDAATST